MNISLANTQSLASKIDEVQSVMLNVKPDLGFFTETWLRETISDSQVNIPGYSFIARNRCVDIHGGVGLYIHDSIKFKPLDEFSDPDFESLWVWLRPSRLPRGFPCLVAGTVYHPQLGANNSGMLNHLTTTLTDIVGQYPGCGIFVCGDFNRLSLSRLTSQFKLKQIIDKPTRGDKILDLVLTNLSHTYDENAVYTLPPFGLSDHNVVIVRTKKRPSRAGPSRKLISRRDTRASRKAELGRFFSAVDWSILDSAPNIDDRSRQLCDIITAGLDAIMPAVKSKVHLNDPPWITPEFKTLIAKRQQAFMSGDLASFRHLRNTVNRERKALRERFFASKVKHLKNTKPSQWWGEVKRIARMTPASGSDNLHSLLHVEGLDHHLPDCDVANAINSAFLDQMKSFLPLNAIPPFKANSAVVTISEVDVWTAIRKLNPCKAAGPDGIPSVIY